MRSGSHPRETRGTRSERQPARTPETHTGSGKRPATHLRPAAPALRYQLPDALMKGGGTGTTLRAGSAGAQRNYGAQPAAGISYSAISWARPTVWNRRLKPTTAGEASASGPSFSWSTAYTVKT